MPKNGKKMAKICKKNTKNLHSKSTSFGSDGEQPQFGVPGHGRGFVWETMTHRLKRKSFINSGKWYNNCSLSIKGWDHLKISAKTNPSTGCLFEFVFFEVGSTGYNNCSMMARLELFCSKHLSFCDFRIKFTEMSSK